LTPIDVTKLETTPEELLKSVDAWRTGHFLLTSGLHSDQYMQCQRVLQYPRYGAHLARLLAEHVIEAGLKPKVVVGPALGAVHWEVFVASALDEIYGKKNETLVRAVFAERPAENPDAFAIRRGIELDEGEEVFVVEDVTTTGGSVKKVIELIKSLGAKPVGVGAIVDRSGGAADFGIPFIKLISLNLKTYTAHDCPMCKEGGKPIKPGSSKK